VALIVPAMAGPNLGPAAQPDHEPDAGWEALVLACFPDICPDFLARLGEEHGRDPHRVTTHLLDEQEQGRPYLRKAAAVKRKRDESDDGGEEAELRRKLERRDPEFANEDRDYVRVYTRAAYVLTPQRCAGVVHRFSLWKLPPCVSRHSRLPKLSLNPMAD